MAEKSRWKEQQQAFLRATRKLTFRARAMRLLDRRQAEFLHEVDAQDRYFQERKGKDALDTLKINPHRVQLFSISEIWHCVRGRLIELNVMKDPDVDDSVSSDGDSTEFEDDFDFIARGRERIGELFKGKKSKDKDQKSVAELMRKNDLKVINKMLERVIGQEEAFLKQKEQLEQV